MPLDRALQLEKLRRKVFENWKSLVSAAKFEGDRREKGGRDAWMMEQ